MEALFPLIRVFNRKEDVFEWKDGTDNKKGNEYEFFVFFLVKTRILISFVIKLENWRADGYRWHQKGLSNI